MDRSIRNGGPSFARLALDVRVFQKVDGGCAKIGALPIILGAGPAGLPAEFGGPLGTLPHSRHALRAVLALLARSSDCRFSAKADGDKPIFRQKPECHFTVDSVRNRSIDQPRGEV